MNAGAAAALPRPCMSIGIVGAGIGGLTIANALKQRGFRNVKVYEQASRFIPKAGAAFGFSPNGQVCLASLGVETRPLLQSFDRLVHLDANGVPNVESNIFRQMLARHGFTIGGCLRADLVDILKESLLENDSDDDNNVLLYSHKLVEIEQDDDAVHLVFQQGNDEEATNTHRATHDLVIGADGIHSTVAHLLQIDDSPPLYSGANIFYGIIEDANDLKQSYAFPPNAVVQGNTVGEFITFGAGPNNGIVQIWAATYPCLEPPPRDEWGVVGASSSPNDDGTSSPELQALLQQFPSSHPIHALAHSTTPSRLLHFGLFYRKHKNLWHKGRTCLLGDSCHATLPYVGQGANQAIEDSIVLADCLSECYNKGTNNSGSDYYTAAFGSYYQQRSKRTKRIVDMANILNRLHHTQDPILKWGRDRLFEGFAKGSWMAKMIEREIVEECPIKDYAKYK